MKKYNIALWFGVFVLSLIVGAGTVQAVKSLSKRDEIQLKQDLKPQNSKRDIALIGMFGPGFEAELADAKAEYGKEYGQGNFEIMTYHGYTLIIPPGKAGGLEDAQARVDAILANQKDFTPSAGTKASQIEKIREIFGIKGAITYNTAIGAYTDEKGFQYNFSNGELINKQVGITASLHEKFEQAYPALNSNSIRTAVITNDQARVVADQIVDKAFTVDLAKSLKTNVQYVELGNARLGITYGNNDVQVLVDKVSGDIIHYSRTQ